MSVSQRIFPGPQLISTRRFDSWRHGEPSLSEVMADPIVHLVMRRDGLVADQVWPVVREAQSRLGSRLCPGVACAA